MEGRADVLGEIHSENGQGLRAEAAVGKTLGGGGRKHNLTSGGRLPLRWKRLINQLAVSVLLKKFETFT